MENILKPGALNGIRVADFSWVWAGPYCCSLLGYLGAEVIKVESMKRVDQTRQGSIFESESYHGVDNAPPFNNANLNKGSISLDLTKPEAVELAKQFIATCDVVVANMRPGKMDKIGLGYEELKKVKPDIIVLESTGFGATGPYRHFSGFAPIFASFGGLCNLTGYADGTPNPMSGVQDLRVGTQDAFAILAALLYRQKTGKGQYIDVSSSEAITTLLGTEMMAYTMNGTIEKRCGNADPVMAPHNVYRTKGKDCWVSIAVGNDEEWQALVGAMGNPEWAKDPKFADMVSRKQNEAELDEHMAAWCINYEHIVLMKMLQAVGVACMPSMAASDILKDPHVKARGLITSVQHPILKKQYVLMPPWKLSETPATIRKCAPLWAESNEKVFIETLGLSREEYDKLVEEKVIY